LSLLIDLFGYLSIVVHGLVIIAQSMMLGGVLFLVLLARPFAGAFPEGPSIRDSTARIAAWSALGLIAAEAATVAMQVAVLVGTVDLPVSNVMQANFAVAGVVKIIAAALIGVLLLARRTPGLILIALGLVELVAATFTTHAEARLSDNNLLLAVEALHQLGAAIWIGGIPTFVMALGRVHDGAAWRRIGARFSRMSMAGVAAIIVSGATMVWFYIGDWAGFYGTAYGVMVGAKIGMLLMLLALGLGNFLTTERLRANPGASVTRMKRFAEVEIGIGFSIFFAAASLTSVPPAVDLTTDRATWHEIVERNAPVVPRLTSPDHSSLALIELQNHLDQQAQQTHTQAAPAFVPGSGELPPRNADDIAWSEYNHHWAGLFVLAIAFLALLNQGGVRWARHWPLVFIGLAVFLFLRSDPEVWPLGTEGIIASLRDVEVVQHRVFVLLTLVFAIFEWRVRAGNLGRTWAAYVFPLLTAAGGALLLTHSHAIANVKDALLIEITHTPLALAAIAAGWARWLELRLDPPGNRIAGWVWPVCFLIIGLILLDYREA
jgi:copper resistance protein D